VYFFVFSLAMGEASRQYKMGSPESRKPRNSP